MVIANCAEQCYIRLTILVLATCLPLTTSCPAKAVGVDHFSKCGTKIERKNRTACEAQNIFWGRELCEVVDTLFTRRISFSGHICAM